MVTEDTSPKADDIIFLKNCVTDEYVLTLSYLQARAMYLIALSDRKTSQILSWEATSEDDADDLYATVISFFAIQEVSDDQSK